MTIYLRTQKKSDTRKTYWGFEPVALSKGRKPAGSYYLRHVDLNGKQKWVPAGQSFTEADELKAKLSTEKTAHSSPREGHRNSPSLWFNSRSPYSPVSSIKNAIV